MFRFSDSTCPNTSGGLFVRFIPSGGRPPCRYAIPLIPPGSDVKFGSVPSSYTTTCVANVVWFVAMLDWRESYSVCTPIT
jgi:hypothetical protein